MNTVNFTLIPLRECEDHENPVIPPRLPDSAAKQSPRLQKTREIASTRVVSLHIPSDLLNEITVLSLDREIPCQFLIISILQEAVAKAKSPTGKSNERV